MEHPTRKAFSGFTPGFVFRAILIICALLIVFITSVALRPIHQGQRLLAAVRSLRIGRSDFYETERIARSTGLLEQQGSECTFENCTLKVDVDNSLVPEIWRGPTTTMGVALTVQQDRLSRISLDFGKAQSSRASRVDFSEQSLAMWKMHSPTEVSLGVDEITGRAVTAFVTVSPSASNKDRERYLRFRLICFARYQGCNYAQELLPSLVDN